MNYIRINKFSKLPLYLQLYNSIKAAIQSGQLKDKDKLPPEEVLAETFNISRPVVRQAYRALLEEGLIERFQGRGSYVSKKIEFSNIFFMKNFNEEVESKGFKPSSHVISMDTISLDDLPSFHFPYPKHANYFIFKRIRKADNIPLFYETSYYPTVLFKDLGNQVTNDISITKTITDVYGYTSLKSECLISAVKLDESLAQLLEVAPQSAAIRFDIVNRNEKNEIIFFKISYFPGERHSIDVDLHEVNT